MRWIKGHTAQSYDAAAKSYDSFYSTPVARMEDWMITQFLEPLPKALGHIENVLDLGCGTGAGLRMLHSAGIYPRRYVGVDMSPGMLDRAHSVFGGRDPHGKYWIQGDMDDHELWNSLRKNFPPMDLAICLFSINYSSGVHSVLFRLREALRFGGRLLVVFLGPSWTCSHALVRGIPLMLYSMTGARRVADQVGITGPMVTGIRYSSTLFKLGRAGAVVDNVGGDALHCVRRWTGGWMPVPQPRYVMLTGANGYQVL